VVADRGGRPGSARLWIHSGPRFRRWTRIALPAGGTVRGNANAVRPFEFLDRGRSGCKWLRPHLRQFVLREGVCRPALGKGVSVMTTATTVESAERLWSEEPAKRPGRRRIRTHIGG